MIMDRYSCASEEDKTDVHLAPWCVLQNGQQYLRKVPGWKLLILSRTLEVLYEITVLWMLRFFFTHSEGKCWIWSYKAVLCLRMRLVEP